MGIRFKVLLVHSTPLETLGGAELSLRHHVENVPARVTVDVIEPKDEVDLDDYHAVILGNLRPTVGMGAELELLSTIHWTKLLLSYRGFTMKSERDMHPCTFRDGRCLIGDLLQREPCSCTHTMRDATELLYNACNVVQFLSPAHQHAINQLVSIDKRQVVIAPPIDLSRFHSTRPLENREPKALILGDEIRVAPTAEQRARDAGFEPKRIEYLSIDYEDMPALYNRYQAVVVDPIMFHAFGRIVAEAMACGCNVLASARVGAISWPDPLAATQDANKKFWSVVVRGTTLSAFRGWFRTSGRARTQHTSGLNESGKPQTKAVA